MTSTQGSAKKGRVVCPSCGHVFHLEDKVVDQLREGFESEAKKRITAEVLSKAEPKIDSKAKRLAAEMVRAQLGPKDEELRVREQEISRLKRDITNLSKKVPEERAQQLGAIRELTLAERLRSRFPDDEVRPIPKGQRGGDVVQVVRSPRGNEVGSILWESKRAKKWESAWVRTLKDNQKRGSHTLAVLVSEAQPAGAGPLAHQDGVPITSLELAVPLAVVLRESLILVAGVKGARAQRDDLKGRVYDYLTSQDFTGPVMGIIESAHRMRQSLEKEKAKIQAQWSERERQLDEVQTDLTRLWGGLLGLEVPQLRIPALEEAPIEVSALPASGD